MSSIILITFYFYHKSQTKSNHIAICPKKTGIDHYTANTVSTHSDEGTIWGRDSIERRGDDAHRRRQIASRSRTESDWIRRQTVHDSIRRREPFQSRRRWNRSEIGDPSPSGFHFKSRSRGMFSFSLSFQWTSKWWKFCDFFFESIPDVNYYLRSPIFCEKEHHRPFSEIIYLSVI